MATKTFCDMCGADVTGGSYSRLLIDQWGYSGGKIDSARPYINAILCPACRDKAINMLEVLRR